MSIWGLPSHLGIYIEKQAGGKAGGVLPIQVSSLGKQHIPHILV